MKELYFVLKNKQVPIPPNFNLEDKYLKFINQNQLINSKKFKINFSLNNTFENYLISKIEEFIPKSITTHYDSFINFINKQNLPKKT